MEPAWDSLSLSLSLPLSLSQNKYLRKKETFKQHTSISHSLEAGGPSRGGSSGKGIVVLVRAPPSGRLTSPGPPLLTPSCGALVLNLQAGEGANVQPEAVPFLVSGCFFLVQVPLSPSSLPQASESPGPPPRSPYSPHTPGAPTPPGSTQPPEPPR